MSIEEIADDVKDLKVEEQPISADVAVSDRIQSKAEKKARKALQNLGLKKVEGITRVTMRRPRGHLYVVSAPEVYKSSVSDVYIVFGEAKNEDMSLAAQQAQVQQMAMQQEAQERLLSEAVAQQQATGAGAGADKQKAAAADDEESDGEVDETGVDAKDIELVMQQVSCSRKKAVKALKASDGDLINAIMNAS